MYWYTYIYIYLCMHTFPFKLWNYVSFLFVQSRSWQSEMSPGLVSESQLPHGNDESSGISWGSQPIALRKDGWYFPPRSSSCKDQNGWDVLNPKTLNFFSAFQAKNIKIHPTWTPENHRKTIHHSPWLWNPGSWIKSRKKCELGQVSKTYLGGLDAGFKHLFSPLPGKMIQFD